MDGDPDCFLEISLDSVLRKAAELVQSLEECTARASMSPPVSSAAASSEGGRTSSFSWSPGLLPSPLSASQQSLQPGQPGLGAAAVSGTPQDTAEQWQKLTAYIVSLEKEVQYYKQLVQDIQSKQASESKMASQQLSLGPVVTPGGGGSGGVQREVLADYWKKMLETDPENHVLLLVFSHLSVHDLCQAALVSRKWYTITKHPLLWKELIMTETVVQPQVLFRLSEWCSSVERLVLHGLMPPIASNDEDLQTYIFKTRGSLEPGLKAVMEASSTTLSSLSITDCNLMATERVLWLASVHCPHLTSLTYCSDEFPPSSESLWSLANGCRQLQHLTLPPVPESPNANWFNDNCLYVIGHAWPNLLSLTIGGTTITPDGLKQIAHKCTKLQFLEVIYGPSLHKEAIEKLCLGGGLQSLSRLVLNFTPASHVALELLIETCSSLELLEMHITIRSYFNDVDLDALSKYNKILGNIKRLKRHSKGKDIFRLYEH